MAQTPNGTSDPTRIRHFCKIVEHCLRECADTRCGPHDVFLWNARRLAEAILYALAEGTDILKNGKNPAPELKDLPRRLVQDGHLHPQLVPYFDVLRSCGNVGAHAQGPEALADETTLDSCKTAIVHVVEWFYRKSKLAREMPDALKADLAELESDQPKPSRSDRHAQQLRDLEAERNQERGKAAYLQSRLAEVTSALRTQPNATPTVTEVVAMAQSGRSLVRKLLLVTAGMVLGGSVAFFVMHFRQPPVAMPAAKVALAPPACPAPSPCPAAPPCPAAEPCPTCEVAVPAAATPAAEPTATDDAPPAEPAAEVAEAEAPPAVAEPAPEVPPCEDGALFVPAGQLRFRTGPSPRPEWSQPRPVPPPTAVPAFCISREALTAETYALAMADGPCKPTRGNAVRAGALHLPVNFVSRPCARQYCASRGGSLPTIAQWERAMRADEPPQLQPDTWELAADPFPFAVFGDAPVATGKPTHGYFNRVLGRSPVSERPFLSWNKDATVAAGHIATSFRCAWPAKSSKTTP